MEPESQPRPQSRFSARQLATMALFIALGSVLAFIPLPIFPPAAAIGITYDPSNVPATIGSLGFGTGAGVIIGILIHVLHALMTGDVVGAAMNIAVVIGFVVPPALICKNDKSVKRVIIGLAVGVVVSVAVIIPVNLIVWPNFYGMPFEAAVDAIVPLIIPFNLMKATLNAVLSFLLYLSLRKLLER